MSAQWTPRVPVIASVFGGPTDPGTDNVGSYGDDLNVKWDSYAELSTNATNGPDNDYNALGVLVGLETGLPREHRVIVWWWNATTKAWEHLTLKKRDKGFGGPGPDKHRRSPDDPRIDIWWKAIDEGHKRGDFHMPIEFLGGVEVQIERAGLGITWP